MDINWFRVGELAATIAAIVLMGVAPPIGLMVAGAYIYWTWQKEGWPGVAKLCMSGLAYALVGIVIALIPSPITLFAAGAIGMWWITRKSEKTGDN